MHNESVVGLLKRLMTRFKVTNNYTTLITRINKTLVSLLDSLKLGFETFSTIKLTLPTDIKVYLCHLELVTPWAHLCGNRSSCEGDSGGW